MRAAFAYRQPSIAGAFFSGLEQSQRQRQRDVRSQIAFNADARAERSLEETISNNAFTRDMRVKEFDANEEQRAFARKMSLRSDARAAASAGRAAAAARRGEMLEAQKGLVQVMAAAGSAENYNAMVPELMELGFMEGEVAEISPERFTAALAYGQGQGWLQAPEPTELTTGAQTLAWRAQQAGLEPGTEAYQRFMLAGGKKQDERVIYGPDGQPMIVEGAGAVNSRFTEAQSRDNVFTTRARGALPTLNQYEGALTSLTDRALNSDPTGVARGAMQSTEFQLAQASGDEFLQAILRKDTGAAITQPEQVLYGRTYLPQPGDGPEVIAYKREARERAVVAIEAGMNPAQMVAQERALAQSQNIDLDGTQDTPSASSGGRNGGRDSAPPPPERYADDPERWTEIWERLPEEDRKLFLE